jgi:uncharacterized repeat protein (TIGR03837 family)
MQLSILQRCGYGKTLMLKTQKITSLALFCKVVDNFGDIGICWRLARQFSQEHDIAVTLWVDDLASFQKICPSIQLQCDEQIVSDVTVRFWRNQEGVFSQDEIADIVIEFFACDIPPHYITTMAQCSPQPLWINLEGLTAEEWVEGCHTLPSPHPFLPITKYFFFPGFNNKTGGLIFENDVHLRRTHFQSNDLSQQTFLYNLGLTSQELDSFKISLFCYAHAPVRDIFEAWEKSNTAITCLVPEGVAKKAVDDYFGQAISVGNVATRGNLSVRVLPFIPQDEYDQLLWSCDLNFVRGEDSFVRAQLAAKPFIWHIYPQDENLHHKKLKAFLSIFSTLNNPLNNPLNDPLSQLILAWNDALNIQESSELNWSSMWQNVANTSTTIAHQTQEWQEKMIKNGDLASNLIKFAQSKRSK